MFILPKRARRLGALVVAVAVAVRVGKVEVVDAHAVTSSIFAVAFVVVDKLFVVRVGNVVVDRDFRFGGFQVVDFVFFKDVARVLQFVDDFFVDQTVLNFQSVVDVGLDFVKDGDGVVGELGQDGILFRAVFDLVDGFHAATVFGVVVELVQGVELTGSVSDGRRGGRNLIDKVYRGVNGDGSGDGYFASRG